MESKLKEAIRNEYGAFVSFAGRGEMIPNPQCYCEIDPERVDAWGIPVLRFHWGANEHEIRQVKHMEDTFASIIETMGGTVTSRRPVPERAISTGGTIIHEAGTVRMGKDPKTSALNATARRTT